jgi:tetratricopeptide (TPR) repeat protein
VTLSSAANASDLLAWSLEHQADDPPIIVDRRFGPPNERHLLLCLRLVAPGHKPYSATWYDSTLLEGKLRVRRKSRRTPTSWSGTRPDDTRTQSVRLAVVFFDSISEEPLASFGLPAEHVAEDRLCLANFREDRGPRMSETLQRRGQLHYQISHQDFRFNDRTISNFLNIEPQIRMTDKSYFGPQKTGGAFSSAGFSYQDACAILIFLRHLEDPHFSSIGLETEDDFSLHFKDRKIIGQVKSELLSLGAIKDLISSNRIIIAAHLNKELETFLYYLKHYRNSQSSDLTSSEKFKIAGEFKKVLAKHSLNHIATIPDTWLVEHLPNSRILDSIQLRIIEWAMKQEKNIAYGDCLNELLRITADHRVNRGFISKITILNILARHTKEIKFHPPKPLFKLITQIEDLESETGKSGEELLSSIREKIREAEIFLQSGDRGASLEIYSSLASIFRSERILLRCAFICQLLDKGVEAESYSDQVLAENPRSSAALSIKGWVRGKNGDYDSALDYLRAAESNDADNAELLYNIGVSYLKLSVISQATVYFRKSLQIDPENFEAHLNLGICLFSSGDYSEALRHVETCLILSPGLPGALVQKGEIKRFFGDYKEAELLFSRGLESEPMNPMARFGLAMCRIRRGDLSGYSKLADYFDDSIQNMAIGEAFVVADIGWSEISGVKIALEKDGFISASYGEFTVKFQRTADDVIGIGVERNDDLLSPMIIKIYQSEAGFINAIQHLEPLSHNSVLSATSGSITGKSNHCEINMNFGSFAISGVTDFSENHGYHHFAKEFRGKFKLVLQQKQSRQQRVFVVTGIRL